MEPLHVILAIVAAVLLVLFVGARLQAHRVVPIDPASPEWQAAVLKARASVPLLRELFADRSAPVLVKYPVVNARGEREHVWGELSEIAETTFRARLETPLIGGAPATPAPSDLALAELEDWMVLLPDGTVRGGYLTQAEIAIARREGRRVPRHVADLEGRFVDS